LRMLRWVDDATE